MKENFLRMLGSLKKDDLKYLLSIYDYFPDELKNDYKNHFGDNIIGPAKKWLSGLKHYDSKMRKAELHSLLTNAIIKANKMKKTDNLNDMASKIVHHVAKLEDIPIDPEMNTRDIENQLFLYEAEEMFPIYMLAIRTMLLMSKQDSVGIKGLQKKMIQTFIDELLVTKEQKNLLGKEFRSSTSLKEIEELVSLMQRKKNINAKQLYSSLLGFAWIIAISDDVITRNEISTYKKLSTIFGIKEGDSNKLKHKIEHRFEEIREETISTLVKNSNKISNKDLSEAAAGISGSLAILGLAETAGFGLFLFATTALSSIGLLFGITFSFATYTSLTWTLGLLTGPVGWVSIPLILASGIILKKYIANKNYEKTRKVIVKLSYMRADI